MKSQTIEISTKTIFIVIATLVGIYFFLKIAFVFVLIFLSFILMSAIDPLVVWFEKRKLPRGISVIFSMLIIIIIVGFFFYITISPITNQIDQIVAAFGTIPQKLAHIFPFIKSNSTVKIGGFNLYKYIFNNFHNFVLSGALNVSQTTINVITFIAYIVFILVMSIYMLIYKEHFYSTTLTFIPKQERQRIDHILRRVELQLGRWLRGQLLISLFVGILFWIYLTILGIPYAIPLSLFAAFCEAIPFVGPIISGVVASLVVFFISPNLFLLSVIAVVIIQQLEANLIAPKIMERVIGINPLIVVIGIFIGTEIGGLLGALIVLPIITVIQLLIYDIWGEEKDDSLSKND